METAPEEVKKLKKWEQKDLDLINKFNSVRNDSESRSFGFSHGNLILKSRSLTIFGNFLLYGLVTSSFFVLVSLFKRTTRHPSFHFFHFRIDQTAVEMVIYIAVASALGVAFTLYGVRRRTRTGWIFICFSLVFVAPEFLFHWSFMGY